MHRSLAWLVIGLPTLAFAGGPLEVAGQTSGADADPRDAIVLEQGPSKADEIKPHGIINGADATIEQYPMTGGMLMDAYMDSPFGSGNIRTFVCSSTLIAPDVVLLAAHCLDGDAFTMGMGSVTFNEVGWSRQADLTSIDGNSANPEWPEDTVFAVDWVTHPDFDLNGMGMGLSENSDIALLFLEEPVLDVPYAYLPSVDEAAQITQDAEVTVVGWGQQSATSGFQAPPAGTYAIKQIGTSYLAEVAEYEMQVGLVESDVRKCHGDSGGPTFMEIETKTETKTRLIGVTSHAYDDSDCNETGGVDTRVDHYLDWIDAEMRARCEDGTRSWCDEPGIIVTPKKEKGGGCGCAVAPVPATGGAWALGLLAIAGLRRRRA